MTNRKLRLSAVLVTGLMLVLAPLASAAPFFKYPPGPAGACPDTLTIKQLKDRLNTGGACSPNDQSPASSAPGDTILGVGGIITGFDEIPTGFDIYIQMTGGGPNTGIDVFTHGNNYRPDYGFNRGDSIVVEFAGVAQFQGDIELEAPNNNFSNPDIVLRKVNSGNPLPPFFTGNTTDLVELPTNTNFAPYVSALVHLNGPVRVARSGDTVIGTRSCLVVRDAAPSDSVFIDFGKMTNILPPAVGSILTSVQGIGNKATRGFRIMPRDADDIVDSVPPGISDAYPVSDTQYRVVFDRSVTAGTATNTGNYTLGSFGSVDAAVTDGSSAAILTVSGTGLLHGQSEQVQVNGMTGVNNGLTMTSPQSRTFLFGLNTCGEASKPNPDTLAANPCVDKALYSGAGGEFLNGAFGTRCTISGIVTGRFGNLYYMEDGTPNPAVDQSASRGITIFAPPRTLVVGHRYLIAGAVEDFWQENEFAAIVYIQDLGTPGVPAPWAFDGALMALGDPCDANQNQLTPRDYLSTLLTVNNVKVVSKNGSRLATGNNAFWVTQVGVSADTFLVENQNTVLGSNSASNPNYPALNTYMNVTGVMHFTNNPAAPNNANNAGTFRICPRNAADIQILGVTGVDGGLPLTLAFSAYPNPSRSVSFAFALPKATKVELGVYDLLGRKVATVASGMLQAGRYERTWNGTDASGSRVHSGIYYYRLKTDNDVRTARTVVIGTN